MRRKMAAGNWKMHGTRASLGEVRKLIAAHPDPACDVLICPPATLIAWMDDAIGSAPIRIGGQDCHAESSGAHTGDIAAQMLADTGARFVIVGHSERRADHRETDADVRAKALAARAATLAAVICVGETEAQRDANETLEVIGRQLFASTPDGATGNNTVIAYEPVWAIGTGRTPSLAQIAEVHDFIRSELLGRFGAEGSMIRILYGGSVKPVNAAEIFATSNVDGALVGGASLKAEDFGAIISALENAGHS
jgi:triosephosphate isomerase